MNNTNNDASTTEDGISMPTPEVAATEPTATPMSQPVLEEAPIELDDSGERPSTEEMNQTETPEEKPVLDPYPPSEVVQQDHDIFLSMKDNETWNPSAVLVPLAPDTIERTEKALDAQPNLNVGDTTASQDWANALRDANYTRTFNDFFVRTVNRPGAKFRQQVSSERGALTASRPKFRENEGVKVTGERAVLRVRASLGLGSVVQVPLWHSGFWVTLKAPSDGDLLELHRRMAEEKITLGRQTYGMAFANTSVMYAGWLTDFCVRHIYDSTLKDVADIRNKISSLDLPLLVWGLACTVWPRGFQYARAVLDQNTQPNRIIREKLNLGKILWVDTAALNPWQVNHMANRNPSTASNDDIVRYRKEFLNGQPRQVVLNEKLSMTLRVPSIDQYLVSGQKWVNGITTMVDTAFGLPPGDDVRDNYIRDQGRASLMRQMGHWVESIDADGNVIDETETVEKILDTLSSEDDLRDKYFEQIRTYMEDSTVAVIAIPATEDNDKAPLPRFPHLLPLDVMSTFFILLVQKATQIQNRL